MPARAPRELAWGSAEAVRSLTTATPAALAAAAHSNVHLTPHVQLTKRTDSSGSPPSKRRGRVRAHEAARVPVPILPNVAAAQAWPGQHEQHLVEQRVNGDSFYDMSNVSFYPFSTTTTTSTAYAPVPATMGGSIAAPFFYAMVPVASMDAEGKPVSTWSLVPVYGSAAGQAEMEAECTVDSA